jgi:hypothetical protein
MRRLGRYFVVALVLLTARLVWAVACSFTDDGADARSRLRYVSQRLITERSAGWGPNEFFAGEWRLVSMSMAALAALNLNEPRDIEALADVALQQSTRAFDTGLYGTDALATLDTGEGHAGYLGHLMLVLGSECALGSRKHREIADAVSHALRRRFLAAPDGLIDTYPNAKWIPDNAAALAGVELYARCRGQESIAQVGRRWPKDREGRLMFSSTIGPRGSGAGMNMIYLPLIDEGFAIEQYALARQTFVVQLPFGLAALREFPEGVDGAGDVDSGPLIFGISPSATGFAIAGPDAGLRTGLLRTAELVGWTVPWGGRHYALGPLVGDASVLAARTAPLSRAAR